MGAEKGGQGEQVVDPRFGEGGFHYLCLLAITYAPPDLAHLSNFR